MSIDIKEPFSPGWWANRAFRKIEADAPRLNLLWSFYVGNPPAPIEADATRKAYANLLKLGRLNVAERCVLSKTQKMQQTGWRSGTSRHKEAEKAWDEAGLQISAAEVHETMGWSGDSYVITDVSEDGEAIVTPEDPRQVVTFHDPRNQRIVRAAAKFMHDADKGEDVFYVYLPADKTVEGREQSGRVYVARRTIRRLPGAPLTFSPQALSWDDDFGGAEGVEFVQDGEKLRHVPVFRFRNRRGVGDFEGHTDHLRRINQQIFQRVAIATLQAFKQRAVKGDLPEKDENGKVIDYEAMFIADPGALWQLPDGVEIWESGVVDLNPILHAVEGDLKHFGLLTAMPLHWISPDAANQSAEGATLQREINTFETEDKIARATATWRDVMRTTLMLTGRGALDEQLEMQWAPVERISIAEAADAASKTGDDLDLYTKLTRIYQLTPEQADDVVSKVEKQQQAKAEAAQAMLPQFADNGGAPPDDSRGPAE